MTGDRIKRVDIDKQVDRASRTDRARAGFVQTSQPETPKLRVTSYVLPSDPTALGTSRISAIAGNPRICP